MPRFCQAGEGTSYSNGVNASETEELGDVEEVVETWEGGEAAGTEEVQDDSVTNSDLDFYYSDYDCEDGDDDLFA